MMRIESGPGVAPRDIEGSRGLSYEELIARAKAERAAAIIASFRAFAIWLRSLRHLRPGGIDSSKGAQARQDA